MALWNLSKRSSHLCTIHRDKTMKSRICEIFMTPRGSRTRDLRQAHNIWTCWDLSHQRRWNSATDQKILAKNTNLSGISAHSAEKTRVFLRPLQRRRSGVAELNYADSSPPFSRSSRITMNKKTHPTAYKQGRGATVQRTDRFAMSSLILNNQDVVGNSQSCVAR